MKRKIDYYEYKAKLMLEHILSLEQGRVELLDKPDIRIDKDRIGVEVTRCTPETLEKKGSYYKKHLEFKPLDKVSEEVISRFENQGYEILTFDGVIGGYHGPMTWHSIDELCMTIEHKVEVIKKGQYGKVKSLQLYLFSNDFKSYTKEDIEKLIESQGKNMLDAGIEVLYLDDCGWFYVCNLRNRQIDFINTEPFHHDICVEAKRKTEEFL